MGDLGNAHSGPITSIMAHLRVAYIKILKFIIHQTNKKKSTFLKKIRNMIFQTLIFLIVFFFLIFIFFIFFLILSVILK